MRVFNIIRYIIALGLLVGCFFCSPAVGVISIFVLLAVNNCLDDVVFYQGSKAINLNKYRGGIACPVNGVVTCLEKDVPLMSHIRKCDYLDDQLLLELRKEADSNVERLYNHATIFLNKFNCHAVTNIGAEIIREVYYNREGELISMVEAGEMVTKLDGRFLNNSFIRTEYANGIICIYTLDKYASKMLASANRKLLGVDYFICRGSQCDVYLPQGMEFCVKENEILINLQTISEGSLLKNNVDYAADAGVLIRQDNCSHTGHIISSNLYKALSTYSFKKPAVLILFLAALCLGSLPGLSVNGNLFALLFIEVYTGLFALDRFVKNLLYSVFNIVGFKPGLAKIYKFAHFWL